MAAGSSAFSSTIRSADGANTGWTPAPVAGCAGWAGTGVTPEMEVGVFVSAAADLAGAGAAVPASPALTRPSSAPGSTVSPSPAAMSVSTPSSGATTSSETLSVSSSTSTSSFLTGSPAFLVQRATVASVTDSPSAGVMMSVIANVLLGRGSGREGLGQEGLQLLGVA